MAVLSSLLVIQRIARSIGCARMHTTRSKWLQSCECFHKYWCHWRPAERSNCFLMNGWIVLSARAIRIRSFRNVFEMNEYELFSCLFYSISWFSELSVVLMIFEPVTHSCLPLPCTPDHEKVICSLSEGVKHIVNTCDTIVCLIAQFPESTACHHRSPSPPSFVQLIFSLSCLQLVYFACALLDTPFIRLRA